MPRTSASAIERARRLRFCASVSTILSGLSTIFSPRTSPRRAADGDGQAVLDQEDGEQHEEIDDRKREHPLRGLFGAGAFAFDAHAPSQADHGGPRDERRHAIEDAGITHEPRRSADGYEQ